MDDGWMMPKSKLMLDLIIKFLIDELKLTFWGFVSLY